MKCIMDNIYYSKNPDGYLKFPFMKSMIKTYHFEHNTLFNILIVGNMQLTMCHYKWV